MATKTGQRPSDLLGYWIDPWTAYQLDNTVVMVGMAIENALQETQNVGDEKKPKWKPKYKLTQLLDPNFRLPVGVTGKAAERAALAQLKGMKGVVYKKVKNKASE